MSTEAAERLRAFIREVRPGGCAIYSQGAACECPLCDVDRLSSPEGTRGDIPGPNSEVIRRVLLATQMTCNSFSLSEHMNAKKGQTGENARCTNCNDPQWKHWLRDAVITADHYRQLSSPSSAPAATPAHLQLNAWREVGEEMERIIEYVDKNDLLPDWFEPRLRELLASPRVSAATPAPEDRNELNWYRHNWGQLRKWLKDQIQIWDAPTLRTQKHLADMAKARFRDVLHEMDQRSAGNREAPVSAAERPAQTWQPIENTKADRVLVTHYGQIEIAQRRTDNRTGWSGWFIDGYHAEPQPTRYLPLPLPAPPGPVAQEKE